MMQMMAGRRRELAAGGFLLLAYGGLVAAAMLGSVPVFAALAAVSIAAEGALVVAAPGNRDLLEMLGLSATYRHFLRDLGALSLLATTVELSRPALTWALFAVPAVWAACLVAGSFGAMVLRSNQPPALVRNIDLRTRPRPSVRTWAEGLTGGRSPFASVPLVVGAVVASATGSVTAFVVSAGVIVGAMALLTAVLAGGLLRAGGPRADRETLAAVQAWFGAQRPEVALYFAGPAQDVYQVNMWLAPVEALHRRCVVVMRSSEAFQNLAPTTLPVLCVPNAVDFMDLDVSSLRVVMYTANVGANIHMLREPGTTHVFIGHGDSDKLASVNPYSKVYDEVWVAGRGGRDRYAQAKVGVRDEAIVEVGRPQLAGLRSTIGRRGDRPFTVLYAPTWEGWLISDVYHTSVVLMGEAIVRTLLNLSTPVRVIYKPHPLTGSRSPQARAANEATIGWIRASGGTVDAVTCAGSGHLVAGTPGPTLFDCFDETDLLISDISSVVADFMQTQRPYVVANPAGLADDEFRSTYRTAQAAYLLSRDCAELEEIVKLTRDGDDPMRDSRRDLKEYLLGPDVPSPLERFRTEVERLCQ